MICKDLMVTKIDTDHLAILSKHSLIVPVRQSTYNQNDFKNKKSTPEKKNINSIRTTYLLFFHGL